ncbi:PEPxxWA-CTERM sorting domain-containing protein [uncultured Sphingomonas sp.]|uniref:PEPxxWA-CTERM sorting domain-containing protein n=1 Tax=uncultured Sphingomonas sp. TaxID=158754 RepID=UPI0026041746|nr:PEPxxWA-CTERM sorting domain-containing protein [uncultured Sphingomonas sp.]
MFTKFGGAATLAVSALIAAAPAQAATVFQSNFQGATFTLTQNSATSATFDIAGVNNLTGNWSTASFLGAFSFNGLGVSAATATLLGGGSTTNSQSGGLNANGCNGNGAGFICFDLSPNVAIAGKNNLTFDLLATSGIFNISAPHLKILWSNSASRDNKVGDLYSQDLKFVGNVGGVPEPATWAMMIFGFGAVGGMMRIRQRKVRYAV